MPHIIATSNVNGIRAAARKGLLEWLDHTDADIVALQETRADTAQLRIALAPALDKGWQVAHAEPGTKGRAGVAILSRRAGTVTQVDLDGEFAGVGRYLEVAYENLTVASVYVHTGEAETPRQDEKYRFLQALAQRMNKYTEGFVIAGDWNIAPTERDLKNWRGNRGKAGFLPEERAWLTARYSEGWTDVVRALNPEGDGPYSWWSYRGRAFDNDAGWRIDYQLTTRDVAIRAKKARTDRAAGYDQRWSDHAPVTVHYH